MKLKTLSIVWYLLALLVIVIDQLTKWVIVSQFQLFEIRPVTSFFNLTLVYNTGAAFSFLSQADGWQRWFFSFVAMGVSLVLIIWITRLQDHQKVLGAALACILGGAIGNLIDRLAYGYVVDFLDFYINRYHWPAFNVADTAISVGAGLLILDMFIGDEQRTENAIK